MPFTPTLALILCGWFAGPKPAPPAVVRPAEAVPRATIQPTGPPVNVRPWKPPEHR